MKLHEKRGVYFDNIWIYFLGNWHIRNFYRLLYAKKVWDKSANKSNKDILNEEITRVTHSNDRPRM